VEKVHRARGVPGACLVPQVQWALQGRWEMLVSPARKVHVAQMGLLGCKALQVLKETMALSANTL